MKNILFLQHYKMKFPFDHWTNMSYGESVRLSRGEASIGINDDVYEYFNLNYTNKDFAQYDAILTSPVLRAKETAQFLKTNVLPLVPILVNKNLTEVTWDLSSFLTEEVYEKSRTKGSYDIGTQRIDAFINGTALTTLKEVDERIRELRSDLLKLKHENIICITHSFLMKVLYLYFIKGLNGSSIKSIDFLSEFPIKYLKGFEAQLD